jgi:large subunit ribosomal protein L18
LKHIYVQVIDDQAHRTLVHASTLDKEVRDKAGSGNVDAAKRVGEVVGQRLKDAGIENVVFDRGGFIYHGRVKALADAVRSAGVKL